MTLDKAKKDETIPSNHLSNSKDNIKVKRVLDIGCGLHKVEGAIGADLIALPGIDVIVNLEKALPFADNSFTIVHAHHILEHINNLPNLLAEIYRVSCSNALVHITVPYFTCIGAFGDPTHVRFFTYRTFEHFSDTDDLERHTWFSTTRFIIKNRWLGFGRLFRLLGIEWWANKWPNIYENFFPYIFSARTLEVTLLIKKNENTSIVIG